MCAGLAGCAGTGGDTGAPDGLRFPCDRGSVEWKGTPFFLLTRRQPCVCVCVCGLCVSACKERSRPQSSQNSLSAWKASWLWGASAPAGRPGLALGGWADISHFTSHCWPALARSRIQFGHPVVREATSSPVSPSSPPPDLKWRRYNCGQNTGTLKYQKPKEKRNNTISLHFHVIVVIKQVWVSLWLLYNKSRALQTRGPAVSRVW